MARRVHAQRRTPSSSRCTRGAARSAPSPRRAASPHRADVAAASASSCCSCRATGRSRSATARAPRSCSCRRRSSASCSRSSSAGRRRPSRSGASARSRSSARRSRAGTGYDRSAQRACSPTKDHTAAMFFVVVSAVWFGTSNAAREIVTERAIYLRERMVNLSLFNYVILEVHHPEPRLRLPVHDAARDRVLHARLPRRTHRVLARARGR